MRRREYYNTWSVTSRTRRFRNFGSAACYWSKSTWKMYAAATYKLNVYIILTAITKGSDETMDISVNDQAASIKLLSKPGMTSATIVSLRIITFLRSSGHSTLKLRHFTNISRTNRSGNWKKYSDNWTNHSGNWKIIQAIGKLFRQLEKSFRQVNGPELCLFIMNVVARL